MEAVALETIEIEYDVVRQSYGEFIEVLRKVLAEYEPAGDRQSVVDYHHAPHPVLPRQRSPHRPARWIHITLRVRDEDHATTLAVRDDNVYLIGFRNRRGQWYEFGFSGGGSRSARVLPSEYSSTFLECDVRYGAIIDGGARKLVKLGLGRWFARDAVRRLSAYEQAPGAGVDERTRRHLARLIVMVCEAARMIPHFETVLDGWDRCTGAITERQVHLLWSWKNMSHAVLRAVELGLAEHVPELDQTWPQELLVPQVDVRNVGQALQIVHLLLNWPGPRALAPSQPPPPPPQDTAADGGSGAADGIDILRRHWNDDAAIPHVLGQQGQCMLDIFGVRAAGFYMRGTISVFDGMRGQTIYSNDDKPDVVDDDDLGTMSDSLDHDDVGDSETRRYGPHLGEWMLSHLRSIYDMSGLGFWNRHSQTKTTITSKPENGSTLVHDLLLTGPYRAISSYGSVSIEIESPTTTNIIDDDDVSIRISTMTDSIDVAAGKFTTDDDYVRIDISKKNHHRTDGRKTTTTTLLLWDCDDDDEAYNRVLTRTISTSHGPLEVTYAVLSNAVEATVQVRLLLTELGSAAGDILIHGRITAGCRDLDAQSLLFRRNKEEKVAVVTRDSHIIPLSRSIVAVPLTSHLLIAASLHTSVASSFSYHTAAEGLLPEPVVARFRPEPSGQEVQSFSIVNGQIEIKVIWGLDF